jgi:hypothetical protein
MIDLKRYITPPNVFVVLVVLYFIVSNERKMYINTGPDPVTIKFEKDIAEMRSKIQVLEHSDSLHVKKIIDYAKIIVQNNHVVDAYSDEQLERAFAELTARKK